MVASRRLSHPLTEEVNLQVFRSQTAGMSISAILKVTKDV